MASTIIPWALLNELKQRHPPHGPAASALRRFKRSSTRQPSLKAQICSDETRANLIIRRDQPPFTRTLRFPSRHNISRGTE
ncbi:hypothetical protein AOLI_G00065570 [Acnodon oligacanthus]